MTPKQLAALRKNAAKGRAKLAQMRKQGIPTKKHAQKIPLDLIPVGKAQPVTPAKRRFAKKEGVAEREAVDALAQLIVASWAEVQRRKGTL
jgi:hypothetical protein